jgi:hypothetical protein
MCPVCISSAVMIAGGATGTGGLTAFVATRVFKRKKREISPDQIAVKEVEDGNDDRSEASGGSIRG